MRKENIHKHITCMCGDKSMCADLYSLEETLSYSGQFSSESAIQFNPYISRSLSLSFCTPLF